MAHARGVSAILMNKYSIYDFICGVQLFQLTNPLSSTEFKVSEDPKNIATSTLQTSRKFSILCTTLVNSSWATLDPIFVKTISLKRKAEKLLGDGTEATVNDDLQLLQQEAELVRMDFQKCVISISQQWRSNVIGTIPSNHRNNTR